MRFLTKLGASLCCAVALSGTVPNVITTLPYHVNLTDSLPRGIYKMTNDPITRGVLVAECLPYEWAKLGAYRGWLAKGSCLTGTAPVLKQVVAIEGDEVEVTDGYIAVNGEVLLKTATLFLDSAGREIPKVARGKYVLEEGQVWLLADNIPNSWDSRYTGPAEVKDIIGTAEAVWVEATR